MPKITKIKEDELKEISETAKKLEILLHYLWAEDNKNIISIRGGTVLSIEDANGKNIDLSLDELADFTPLKSAYLEA